MVTYKKIRGVHWERVILCIEGDPEEGCLGVQVRIALDVLVNLALSLEVRYEVFSFRYLHSTWQRAPDEVFKGRGLGRSIGKVLALLDFD